MTNTNDDILLIEVSEQPIALCQLLKIANLVSGGGEAKIVISEGYVFLNDEVEYQKRKKVYDGDIVEFNGEIIQVSVNKDSLKHSNNYKDSIIAPDEIRTEIKKNTKKNKTKTPIDEIPASIATGRRKPISF